MSSPHYLATPRLAARRNPQASRTARTREAAQRDAAPALAKIVAVETIGHVRERNPCGRVRPSELTTKAGMPECLRRVRPAKSAQIGFAVAARDDDAQRAIGKESAQRILEARVAYTKRIAKHLRLPNLLAVVRAPVVQQRLIKECEVARRGDTAAGWRSGLTRFNLIELQDHRLIERGHRDARRRHPELLILLVARRLSDPCDIGHPIIKRPRQSHSQIRQAQRLRDSRAYEIAIILPADTFDYFRNRPEVRRDVIRELRPRRMLQAPLREARETPLLVAPFLLRARRRRDRRCVSEQVLDRDGILAVGAELGNKLHDQIFGMQLPLLHQYPRRSRCECLGARHDIEEG